MAQDSAPGHLEEEFRLTVTQKPISRDPNVITYYLCGKCGIVLGGTPTFIVLPGMVVGCQNCGAHNEL